MKAGTCVFALGIQLRHGEHTAVFTYVHSIAAC